MAQIKLAPISTSQTTPFKAHGLRFNSIKVEEKNLHFKISAPRIINKRKSVVRQVKCPG